MRDKLFEKYAGLPPIIHRATDPILKTSIRISESRLLSNMKSKGDAWVNKKKSQFGKIPKKKR